MQPVSVHANRGRIAALVAGFLLLGTACGTSSGSGSAKPGGVHLVDRGQATCPQDQVQDLTFSGGFAGRLTCQAKQSTCFWNPPQFTKVIANIPLLVDGKAGIFYVSTGFTYGLPGHGLGTYEVPKNIGAGATQFSLQLADLTNWLSRPGGLVKVLTDDGSRVAGTVEGELDGPSRARVAGRWACVRASS